MFDNKLNLSPRDKEEDKDKDKRRRRGKRILDKTLKERRSSKTLTEQDIKHIERHLSMKRTIRYNHEITKYGIHSFTQIALAVVRELTCRQDSAPDWLNKSSRQLVICIYRQRTNKLTKG